MSERDHDSNDPSATPENRGLSRRGFLQVGALAAVAGAAGQVPGLSATPAAAQPAPRAFTPPPFELEEATVQQLQDWMRGGRYTARSITEAYLGRIEAMDRQGPALRSVIETNPDALRIADSLDAERKAGRVRGPLHGIPVLVKDNVDTADRMQTTAGSYALEGAPAPRDAFLAERLRAAGAIILGKANLSEWANFRSTHASSGWSGRGGQCLNPYALDRTPCGSSSGSGAAVAANFAAVAVGTETDGSIVCPSSSSSVVGIKPTLGLVSRAGVVPLSHSQDTAGPMARTVADAAALLSVLAGVDPRDAATAASRGHVQPDYTRFLDPNGLRGARIGVARKRFFGADPHADRVVNAAIEEMRKLGAVIVDPADVPHLGEYDEDEFNVLLYDFKADLAQYFASRGPTAKVRTLKDVIDYNERDRAREMPYFGQEIMLMAQEKGPLTDRAYVTARAKCVRLAGREGIDAVMAQHRLDAIVAPTGSLPWAIDLLLGDHGVGGSSTPAAVAGYPNITVPAGYAFGLPVGVSFIGRAWSEPTLIKLAFAFEQGTKHRKPPRFLPTADFANP
ncbi:amidase [Longimicrobium sp.]|uniref:amidase n=1 Tax=Longimicrobium sp. TaxID=2029185 RepID=UPI002C755E93|nr:amidase [Longimicrobium sp.]HSU15857.1 amidase [Longimicrobium sp.]